MNKRIPIIVILLLLFLGGCSQAGPKAQIVPTTGPVYQFTLALCAGTDLTVDQLITDEVSCLHDYTLRVSQMQSAESAETVIISGAGLEEFMQDVLAGTETVIDCSEGIQVMSYGEDHHHEHEHSEDHHHEHDPHIWLSPENAAVMARNICVGLCQKYPQYSELFQINLEILVQELTDLHAYGQEQLTSLSSRDLITFHDGFAYFAHSFDLHILKAVEEESGSEASAKELKELITLVRAENLPAIFTEITGSEASARVISRETGIPIFQLDMAMSSPDYFESMYKNINTVKEALG